MRRRVATAAVGKRNATHSRRGSVRVVATGPTARRVARGYNQPELDNSWCTELH